MPAIERDTAHAAQTDVSTAQQTEHLLIVSIGPVQDFIAAARWTWRCVSDTVQTLRWRPDAQWTARLLVKTGVRDVERF